MARKQRNYHLGGIQSPLFTPSSDWLSPSELPDLRGIKRIALDRETKDDGLAMKRGPGWAWGAGHVCGVSVAWREGTAGESAVNAGTMRSFYAPIRHPDTPGCFDKDAVARWEIDHQRAGVKFVMQQAPYDVGFGFSDMGVPCPPLVDDSICMAYMVDENRPSYDMDSLCKWRGLPGKDESLLREALSAYGWPSDGKEAKNNLWRLPARYVGPYAEVDAVRTLELAESLDPEINAQGVRQAYDLEMALLPLVHEMRRRGIRVDLDAAEVAYVKFKKQSAAALEELGRKLGKNVTIDDVRSYAWLEMMHMDCGVRFPRAWAPGDQPGKENTGRGIFDANVWMKNSEHWLPQLIVKARSREDAAEKFIKNYIIGFANNGRLHASINQFKSEEGGTRTYRFSYAEPPLQQMPARDDDIADDVRGCFLPEDGEFWLREDVSQQEVRLDVHFAEVLGLRRGKEAADRYRNDPMTDFHRMVADWTGMERDGRLKAITFMKSYGAGVPKLAAAINKSEEETQAFVAVYDRELPFMKELEQRAQSKAERSGFIRLLDGARIHYDNWEPTWLSREERDRGRFSGGKYKMTDCSLEEARARVIDKDHPWFGKRLRRARCRKAMSGLIQGSAARQTKRWMKLCWDAGHVPMIQIHDELGFSMSEDKSAEIAQLLKDAFPELRVPFQVGIGWGDSWGDAQHSWEKISGQTAA